MRLGPVGIEELLDSSRSEDPSTNLPKTASKFFQNPSKTIPKSTPNPRKIYSWGSLGPSWPPLGPSWRQEALKNETRRTNRSWEPPRASILGEFPSHVGTMLGHVALQERMGTTSCELVHQGLHLTPQLGPTWPQVGPT